jgi:hypothetical protein
MARRKARKTQPVELTILTDLPVGSSIADIGNLASQINRKTFRQGYQYMIEKIEFYTVSNDPVTISVARLPNHWPSINAWTKTMSLWRKQQDDRLAESGLEQTIAAHRDFKIYMDSNHADGNYTELQARTGDVTTNSGYYMTVAQAQLVSPSVTKDWDKSQIVLPNKAAPGNTVEYFCHMLGPDSTGGAGASFGMIKAYADSRNRPMQTDPNIVDVASGGIFGEMFDVDEATGDIVTNAQEANTATPYLNDIDTPIEFYPGGSEQAVTPTIQDILQIVPTGNRTVASSVVPGFIANCGLILFSTDQVVQCKITLAPGEYKGLMARPMQDVN